MKKESITKKVLNSSKLAITFRLFSCIIARVFALSIPIFFAQTIDLISKGNYNNAITTAIIGVVLAACVRLVEILLTYTWHYLHTKVYSCYTSIALDKLFGNSIFSISRFSMGEFLNIMNQDINVMASFYPDLIRRIVSSIEVIIIFVYFFIIGFYFGIFSVVVFIIGFMIILLTSKKITEVNDKKSRLFDNQSSILNELLLSIKEIKVLNIRNYIKNRALKSTIIYVKSILKQRTIEDAIRFSTLSIIEIFRWGLLIFGIFLISKGNLELGTLIIIYNYYAQLIDSFGEMVFINTSVRQFKVSSNRFNKIIEYSREEVSVKDKDIDIEGDIEFKNILYGYRNNPTLNNVSFKLLHNSINAITGVSGSGKSAILYLLLKLNRQHEGVITINNVDINDIPSQEYYSIISSVDKAPTFFNVSIKENLNVVEEDFKESIELCKKFKIHDEIENLKFGYDTIMNSNDDTLKISTKTLLAIVRMFLKKPKIMIFDEAFSHLNKSMQVKIIELLFEYKKNHTIILMTKEPKILEHSDNIIFLNNGIVKDTGTHEKLLNNNEMYEEMIKNH